MVILIFTALAAVAVWPLVRLSNRAVERERVEERSRLQILRELNEIEIYRPDHIVNYQQEE